MEGMMESFSWWWIAVPVGLVVLYVMYNKVAGE